MTAAVLKLPSPASEESVWDVLSLLLLYPTSGTSKGIPSRMGLILDISPRTLEKVLYFASYVVLDPGVTSLQYKQVLSEKEYREEVEKYGSSTAFRVGMGAEAIRSC